MATTKITDLTAYTDPVSTDVLPIVDVTSDVTKKVSIANLLKNASLGTAALPGIAFDGDPNTGIYSPGADQVAISTNGTGRLFVDASGNVKVSTGEVFNTSATGYIRVAGGDGAGSGASILAFGQSHGSAAGRLALTAIGSESMQFNAGGSERMRITSAGLLGLGTSSPGQALSVVAPSNAQAIGIWNRASDNTYGAIYFKTNDGATDQSIIQNSKIGTNGAQLSFYTKPDGGSVAEKLTIDSTGRVGIGTTSPSDSQSFGNAVDLRGSTGGAYYSATSDNTTRAYFATFTGAGYIGTETNHPLLVRTNNTERARIDTSGRLLVGTSSTSEGSRAVFQGWSGDSTGSAILKFALGTATPAADQYLAYFDFTDSGHLPGARFGAQRDGGTWSASSKPSRLVFSTTADGAASPTERMRIGQNGVVTVKGVAGSANPDFQLEAPGVIGAGLWIDRTTSRFYAWCGGPQTTGVYLTNAATSWTSTSDERQKTDLQPINDGLNKIGQLRSVTGRYITDNEDIRRSFLIAQDVQSVLPEAVDATNPDSLGVSYTDMIPLLVAALKESKERIETLEAKVAALEAS